MNIKHILMIAPLGMAAAATVSAAFAQGVTQRDTGGLSMGGVNAVNRANAGVVQPLHSIQADGVRGVNAVNVRQSGVKHNLKRLDADTKRGTTIVSQTRILRY